MSAVDQQGVQAPAVEVTLLGRPGCHLCEEARDVLVGIGTEVPFRLLQCSIEDDDALLRAHLERIPVVLVDGEEVCHLEVDAEAVRRALEAAGARPGPSRR